MYVSAAIVANGPVFKFIFLKALFLIIFFTIFLPEYYIFKLLAILGIPYSVSFVRLVGTYSKPCVILEDKLELFYDY